MKECYFKLSYRCFIQNFIGERNGGSIFLNVNNSMFFNDIILKYGGGGVPYLYVSAGFGLFLVVSRNVIVSIVYCLFLFHVIPCLPSFIGGGLLGGFCL